MQQSFLSPLVLYNPLNPQSHPREIGSVIIPFYRCANQGPGLSPVQVSQLVMGRNKTHAQSSKDEGSRRQRKKRDVLARGAESWTSKAGQWWHRRRCSQSPRLPWGRTVGEPCLGITPCQAPTLAKLCKGRAKPLTLTIRAPSPALPRYHECLLG